MRAFAEWLLCPTFILRSGAVCDHYSAAYDFAVVVAVPWRSLIARLFGLRAPVIVKALVSPDKKQKFSAAHKSAMVAEIERLGFKPTWDRYNKAKKRTVNK